MNATTTAPGSQSIAGAFVAAVLAIAAIAGLAYGLSRLNEDPSAGDSVATISWPKADEAPLTYFYIVESEAERDAILAAEAKRQLDPAAAAQKRELHFFVVTSPEHEMRIWDLLSDVDLSVQIVDTRFQREFLAIQPSPDIAVPAGEASLGSCPGFGIDDSEVRRFIAESC
jgi:hypothetical protein